MGTHMLPRLDPGIIQYPINQKTNRDRDSFPENEQKAGRDPAGEDPPGQKQKTEPMTTLPSLGERIRTSGLLNPIQARYQTAPHPGTAGESPQQMVFYQIHT